MKNILFFTFMFLLFFLCSCVSTSEYQQLRFEFEQLKAYSGNQYSELNNDMALFKASYNPGLQEVFSENVKAAEKHKKTIEELKYDIEIVSDKIKYLLNESENDRDLIAENLMSSTAQNVVNEFRQLNYSWANTIYELTNLTANSEKAAESSHRAAMRAAEKAGSAERSADYAVESMNQINEQAKSLGVIQEKIKNMESEIRKINRQINKTDEPERKKH